MHNTFYFVAPVRYPQAVSLMPPLSLALFKMAAALHNNSRWNQPLCSDGELNSFLIQLHDRRIAQNTGQTQTILWLFEKIDC